VVVWFLLAQLVLFLHMFLLPGSFLSVSLLSWVCDRFPLVGAGYLRYTVLELC
jgi:hypothetical protein